jgi:hypothetical protein
MALGGKPLVVCDHGVGGGPERDIVVAGVEEDQAWPVGEDDAVEIAERVGEFGATEAAVDGREVGEILLKVLPNSSIGPRLASLG